MYIAYTRVEYISHFTRSKSPHIYIYIYIYIYTFYYIYILLGVKVLTRDLRRPGGPSTRSRLVYCLLLIIIISYIISGIDYYHYY